jgi:hypothetical protein
LRNLSAIVFVGALALVIWHWKNYYYGFDNITNEDEDDNKFGVYTLYPKYVPMEDKPTLKLGPFVERDTIKNNVLLVKHYEGYCHKIPTCCNQSEVFSFEY